MEMFLNLLYYKKERKKELFVFLEPAPRIEAAIEIPLVVLQWDVKRSSLI